MDIGTAKPSVEELNTVKHYLIDVAEIDETWSLALFQQEVYRIAETLWAGKKVPFLVGGTGQFVRAILEGWVIPSKEPDLALREAIKKWGDLIGAEVLHEKLRIIDPNAADKIEFGNMRRTIRALEVIFSSGDLFSTQRKKRDYGFRFKVIGLNRDRKELYQRVDDRIEGMFAQGFEAEVRSILSKGFSPDLPALSAIGYKEVIDYINGEIVMTEVIRLMKKRTRDYVRRQANWFKKDDPRIKWFELNNDKDIYEDVKEFISSPEGWQNG